MLYYFRGNFYQNKMAQQQAELDRLSEAALTLHINGSAENDYTRWGLTPNQPSFLTLITHQFMHGGWLHLLSNMFLLLLTAPAIEDRWGRALFAGLYLLAGIAVFLVALGGMTVLVRLLRWWERRHPNTVATIHKNVPVDPAHALGTR